MQCLQLLTWSSATRVELGAGSGLVSLAIALGLRPNGISNTLHVTDGLDVLLPLIGMFLLEDLIKMMSVLELLNIRLISAWLCRMLTAPEQNISLNKENIGETTTVIPSQLQWGKPLPNGVPEHPDILLVADCCYVEASFPLLFSTMMELIGKETMCFFYYKKRRRADKDMIRMLMKTNVLLIKEIEGEWKREAMFLYEISRKI